MRFSKICGNFVVVSALLCASVLTVAGCKYRYIDKPEHLLSPQEMSEVICRLAYIKALEEQGAFERDSVYAAIGKDAFILKLYADYGIDKETLRRNNEYYMEHNKLYVKIYADALDQLNARIGEMEKDKKKRQEAFRQTGWGTYD